MLLSRAKTRRSYDSGSTYCSKLELYELTDWRLPTVGELGSFADAHLVKKGRYWTGTEADTQEDHFLVRDLAKHEIESRPRDWGGAAVLCVREMKTDAGAEND